jgi:hypothetical protein
MIDETESVTLHRVYSMARLLMSWHPRVAAELYTIHLGDFRRFKLGWNESRRIGREPHYIHITPVHGTTTRQRPAIPSEEINIIEEDDLPDLASTAAWQHLLALCAHLEARHPQKYDVILQNIKTRVLAAAARPLAADPFVDASIEAHLAELQRQVSGPTLEAHVFAARLLETVREYLDLRVSRIQAANVMAVLLTQFIFKFRPHPAGDRWACLLGEIDHLASAARAREGVRWRSDLGGFYWNTCLALLYAETILVMCDGLGAQAPEAVLKQLLGHARYVDEWCAWELSPTLLLPQRLFPAGPNETAFARRPVGRARYYPGNSVAMPSETDLPPAALWKDTVTQSRTATEALTWDVEQADLLLSSELRDDLRRFQLTRKLSF